MKKFLKVLLVIVVIVILAVAGIMIYMKISNSNLDKYANATVDVSTVADGTYVGEQNGFPVSAKVEVTVKDHTISDIKILKHRCGKGKPAETMVPVMIEQNTSAVDGVSGATMSSKTIRAAVNNALSQGCE